MTDYRRTLHLHLAQARLDSIHPQCAEKNILQFLFQPYFDIHYRDWGGLPAP